MLLRKRIGRHNRAGGVAATGTRHSRSGGADARDEAVDLQCHADDARARDEDLFRGAADRRCRLLCHLLRMEESLRASTRIGAAAVDDDSPDDAAGALDVLARDRDRRGLSKVGGKQRCS